MCCLWWRSLKRTAVSKLVCQISFWWFFTQRWKTLWSSSWSWWRPNQSNNRFGSSQYNTWDCREASCITYMHWNHLKQLGYFPKLDTWLPHELKETHVTPRINSCDLLKKRNENDPFLKRLITGDEKWVVYNNIKRKRSWSRPGEPTQTTSKADIHQKKVLLSVWWDYKGIVYFELLPPNRTINSDVYIEQLTKLNNAVEEKRPELTNRKGIVFHHDSARPYTYLTTRQKLFELGWDVLPHPPYSPDLAPSDYFLFRSLQNSLNGKNFNNDDDVKSYLIQFFANKNQKFYERGIMMLPERWQKVIDQNGQYITE